MTDAPRGVALVTGASRGLGLTLARFLAAEGFDLVITARSQVALEAARSELRRGSPSVVALAGDVRDPGHRQALAGAVRRLGGLDLLVNNASELGTRGRPELSTVDLEVLRAVYETNVVAPLALVQALLESLSARHGTVVNISSDAALGAYPGWGAYGSSKAALDVLSRTLAVELAGRGVSVVSVDPGDLRTQMHQDAFEGEDISDRPLPEVTLPFWAWLLGQDGSAITGRRLLARADTWEVA